MSVKGILGKPNYTCQKKPDSFSPLEKVFKDIVESDSGLKELAESLKLQHEWHIQGKTVKNGHTTNFNYWLDFFSPIKNADLEIHHNGHRKGKWWLSYCQTDVYSKDKVRTKRLARLGIKTVPLYQERLTKGWIHQTLTRISQLPNAMTLDVWIRE